MEKAKMERSWNGGRFLLDLVQVFRYLFWGLVFHKLALHYFYHSSLSSLYMGELFVYGTFSDIIYFSIICYFCRRVGGKIRYLVRWRNVL